jgi:hypothetical protein
VKIIVEGYFKVYALIVNAFVEMVFQENHVHSNPARIVAQTTESVLRVNVSVSLDLKGLIAQLKFVLIIALGMEYVLELLFINVPVMMDLLEMTVL